MSGPRGRSSQDQYYAYFGTFEIDERAQTVVHRVQGALRPDEVGVNYKQDFTLSQDQLTLLTARHLVDGEERRNQIVWRRAKESEI
jgi:hypothetical protein